MSQDITDRVDVPAALASLFTLLALLRRTIDLELRVSMPARIVTFDPAACKATVRLELLQIREVQGEDVPNPPDLITLIPVEFPGASTGGITFPLLPNDTGRVVMQDRAIAAWLQTGNPVAPVDPESGRTHDLGDAVFVPGLKTDADAIAAGPIDMTATVVDGAALVKLGANAVPVDGAIALAQALHTYLVTVVTAAVPTPLDGGLGFKTSLLAALGANPFTMFATTKAIAE